MLHCRFCNAPLEHTFVDLGSSPPCESFLTEEELHQGETFYPLHVRVCAKCLLVQIPECLPATEIFDDYAYFSSFSDSWLAHASDYCEAMIKRFGLNQDSFVVELASNDGYLLRNFVKAGVPCLGIEPSGNVAEAAKKVGVESLVRFFGIETASQVHKDRGPADLITANNVLAHVPDINDFVAGAAHLLSPNGVITYEFPHLSRLIEECQYDTIYHEHFSYLSLLTVQTIATAHDLTVFDVEELPSHGGSLRVFLKHKEANHERLPSVDEVLAAEESMGLHHIDGYLGFQPRVEASKRSTLKFLIEAREKGERIVAYGAPGKGNTLLNYCGIRSDLIEFAVDRNPYKHGRYTPGTHIPIHPVEALDDSKPDWIMILPWNLQREITAQLAPMMAQGTRFVVPIPTMTEVKPTT
jgi:SAM-dependent methyltransferase